MMGREKKITYADNNNNFMVRSKFSQGSEVTGKIGWENRFRSTSIAEVSPKVGSVEFRDLSIRKPQMKVGKPDFIDTYSPF